MKKNTIEEVITVDGSAWQEVIQKAFKKVGKDITMDGFRKGKVPFDKYVNARGIESLYMDAVDIAIADVYNDVVNKYKETIVARPSVDIKDINADAVTLTFTITTKPEVKLGKYKGLKVAKEEIKVTKEEVKAEIDQLIKRYADIVEKTNGTVVTGDVAIIDFEGFKDGVPFDGGKGEAYSLEIGSNTFIPGFEEQVIGMSVNEEKEINVTFPNEYPSEDLKGQAVVFKVKVNTIKTKVYPEMDDNFFADLNMPDVKNAKELEKSLEDGIKRNKENQAENTYIDKLLSSVSEAAKVEVPEAMVSDEVDRMYQEFSERLTMQGMNADTYLQMTGMSIEDLRAQMQPEANKRILYRLVLEAIRNEEKITVEEKDVKAEVKLMAERYNMDEKDLLKNIGGLDMIKFDLEMRKTVEFLKENN